MKGLPSHFGTRADIENCMAADPAGTKVMLERLLFGRFGWVRLAELPDGDDGESDEMHEVRLEPADPDADPFVQMDVAMVRVQYERQDDPLAELFRLGLSVRDVQGYIDACEAADA